jgi:predicted RNA-binding protein with PUA-like domain
MNWFLAKSEPQAYSIGQLEKDRRTTWDGVKNPQAVKAILAMKPGDKVFIYHSGGESAIVGVATVVKEGRADPKDPKSAVADFEFASKIDPPVTLAEVKASKKFEQFALVRQSRLSTMQVPEDFVAWVQAKHPQAPGKSKGRPLS